MLLVERLEEETRLRSFNVRILMASSAGTGTQKPRKTGKQSFKAILRQGTVIASQKGAAQSGTNCNCNNGLARRKGD